MKHVKAMLLIAVLAICSTFLLAQETEPSVSPASEYIDGLDLPIATTENLFTPMVNPALMGLSKTIGTGYFHLFDKDKIQRHYWFTGNFDGLSYLYEYDNGINYHAIASGSELFPRHIFPNVYAGTSYRWKNSLYKEGSFRSGVTYRPHNVASLAFTWDNPYEEAPSYKYGIGLRPLAFVKSLPDYALELSMDMAYAKEMTDLNNPTAERSYEMKKPVFGINTQLLDGLTIGANYNTENKTTMVNFALSYVNNSVGSVARAKDDSDNPTDRYALSYIQTTDKFFKPLFGIEPKTWYDMKLKGNVVTYRAPKYKLGPFSIFQSGEKSIETVINEVRQAKDDPTVHGLLFKNPYFGSSFALMQELLTAMKEFKETGKPIAFYYDNMSNGNFFFAASIADKIYLNKNGSVDLKGLSISSPYLKDALAALGIEVMNFRSHDYKTAGNMFSESEMTKAEREVYDSLLSSLYGQVIAQIEAGRGSKLAKPVTQIVDEGPYWVAKDALDAGLVDELIYLDQLEDQLKKDFTFKKTKTAMNSYHNYDWARAKENQVAVIYAQGNIVTGKGTPGQTIASETTVDLIRKARKNPVYKGIILRVDSGGGSAFASDVILHELELAQTENKKKVVVTMTGMAASGGYFIACKADKIIAHPTTLTGSIGVVGIVPNLEKMWGKIRVNWSTVKKGERSDIGSMSRAWKDDEIKLLERSIKNSYDEFIGYVATGRNLDVERVHEIAQGRVWTGEQALGLGLVDEMGGMKEAKAAIKELANIKGKVTLVDATTTKKGIELKMSDDPFSFYAPLRLINGMFGDYISVYEKWSELENEKILMLAPVSTENIDNK